MKVCQTMIENVVCVLPDTSYRQLWKLMIENHLHGIPIVNEDKYLLGIVAEEDLLKKIYPSYQDYFDDFFSFYDLEKLEENVSDLVQLKAHQIMNRHVYTTTPEAPILKALAVMMIRQVRQLPVVDTNKKLVGIISRKNIFSTLFTKKLKMIDIVNIRS